MSEHSIEELERQHQAARDRLAQAQSDVFAAAQRLQDARNEASGVAGHVLEYALSRGWGANKKTLTKRILVEKVTNSWTKDEAGKPYLEAHGTLIVASGKPGNMRGRTLVHEAKDLGPYVAA